MSGRTAQTLTLQEVVNRLVNSGVRWVVFAGAAAGVYGATRPTTDVDILVPAAEGDRVASLFPEGEAIPFGDGHLGIQLPGIDIVAGLPYMDLDADMAERLTLHRVAGVAVNVVPVEDNILLKGIWGRGSAQGKHDWEDVEAMMAYGPALDWTYLRRRARLLSPASQVRRVLERLEELGDQRSRHSSDAGQMLEGE